MKFCIQIEKFVINFDLTIYPFIFLKDLCGKKSELKLIFKFLLLILFSDFFIINQNRTNNCNHLQTVTLALDRNDNFINLKIFRNFEFS